MLKCVSKLRIIGNNINFSTSRGAGKVVVVSGASSGIGKEISLLYAKQSARLVLSARRQDRLESVAESCMKAGAENVEVVVCDVSNENDCKNMIERAVTSYGGLDILVLNAGVGQSFFLEAMKPDVNIRQFMDVNYYGCVYPTIAALPHLQKSVNEGGGKIGVISSVGGLVPFPRQTLYNASKYALFGFFDSLRMELQSKQSKISITMICPGFVKTEITAGGGLGRDGKPIGSSGGKMPVKMITALECATG